MKSRLMYFVLVGFFNLICLSSFALSSKSSTTEIKLLNKQLPVVAQIEACEDSSVFFSHNKIESHQAASICTNKMRNILFSRNCLSANCEIRKLIKKADSSKFRYTAEIGTPGFQACSFIGGKPEIIKFQFNAKKYALDRCLDPKNKSFVSTDAVVFFLSQQMKEAKK